MRRPGISAFHRVVYSSCIRYQMLSILCHCTSTFSTGNCTILCLLYGLELESGNRNTEHEHFNTPVFRLQYTIVYSAQLKAAFIDVVIEIRKLFYAGFLRYLFGV
jgi:hypothetical protein